MTKKKQTSSSLVMDALGKAGIRELGNDTDIAIATKYKVDVLKLRALRRELGIPRYLKKKPELRPSTLEKYAKQIERLGTVPDHVLAAEAGIGPQNMRRIRRTLGIAPAKTTARQVYAEAAQKMSDSAGVDLDIKRSIGLDVLALVAEDCGYTICIDGSNRLLKVSDADGQEVYKGHLP